MPAKQTDSSSGGDEMARARLLTGLDRYLQAAGVNGESARHRLARAVLHSLRDQLPQSGKPDWQALIAAVDTVLSGEHQIDVQPDLLCRGRIAQGYGTVPQPLKAQLDRTANWGSPLPSRRPMPAQALSTWRPRLAWLGSPSIWRPAQGVMISLCCLAVVFVP
ncbi:hypothetical protein HBA54_02710 [Pelagibius litoralis]|uniref:Uncharacterized protein n=1 Tax=Pelagibius litoralis TaxID=374515 RepID=A0A967C315_9PROT|nr:hypothetical protein [Pelagibius litoralis]NIA67494.1 hypothetical protein [Pelagibius litoralis]